MLFLTGNAKGQNASLADFINCIELRNGTDNLLMNGRPYVATNQQAEGHPYFQTAEWTPGLIYVNGKVHFTTKLKYNLSTHQLIVKHKRPNGTTQNVVLSTSLVDSFYIRRDLFVNQSLVFPERAQNDGYLEEIFSEKIFFYRFQRKVFDAIYNNDIPNGRFTNQKDIFYLLLDGKSYKITKKKELLACFPNRKGAIKKYMKDQSLRWKKMSKIQFSQLLKFCNDQI